MLTVVIGPPLSSLPVSEFLRGDSFHSYYFCVQHCFGTDAASCALNFYSQEIKLLFFFYLTPFNLEGAILFIDLLP